MPQKASWIVRERRNLDMNAHVLRTSIQKIIVYHGNNPGEDMAFLTGVPHGIEGFLPDEIIVGDFGLALGDLLQPR